MNLDSTIAWPKTSVSIGTSLGRITGSVVPLTRLLFLLFCIGEYFFYVKMMKSFPAATQIHYPGFDWVAELGISKEDARKYL